MQNVVEYRALRPLSTGGMAEVHEGLARSANGFERRVVIKRLRTDRTDEMLTRMFLDEARIASQLHHGNIVSVLDYGVADGRAFQVHELVEGIDLKQLFLLAKERGQSFPVELALLVCLDVTRALSYVHAATDADGRPLGVIHRDVKPANILVSWSGDVKLTDFGVAFADERTETTRTGVTKGTPAYMAPEQAAGDPLDGRADVFAMGCVLHYLLTGRSPLASLEELNALMLGRELELDSALPSDLRPIVERAVRADRCERYDNAEGLAADLGTSLARRIDQDAHVLFREWLDGLKEAEQSAPVGALDALLDVAFVLGPGEASEVMTKSDRPPAQSRSRGPYLGVALAALVAVMTVGAIGMFGARNETDVAVIEPVPSTATTTTEVPPPIPAEVPSAPPAPVRRSKRARRAPPPAVAPPPAPKGSGFVTVGGAVVHQGEIFVDGVSKGFAPRRLELPAGPHEVVVVLRDGRRVGPERITVSTRHTPSAPLRWRPTSP